MAVRLFKNMKINIDEEHRSSNILTLLLINVAIFMVIALMMFLFGGQYERRLWEQNVTDIKNLNSSATNTATYYFTNRLDKIFDIQKYVQDKDLKYSEAIDYIFASSASNDIKFQLINTKNRGHQVTRLCEEDFVEIDYNKDDYRSIQGIFTGETYEQFGGVYYTPEFIDYRTGQKTFGIYQRFTIKNDEGKMEKYTLLSLASSEEFASLININGGYDDMNTVLVSDDGDYIFTNEAFKGDNFISYLAECNDLSKEEIERISDEIDSNLEGQLTYKNADGDKCLFTYTRNQGSKWYCVTSVPLKSFRDHNIDYSFSFIAIIAVVFLFIIDVIWLLNMNKKLRVSMEKERIANNAKTDFLSRMSHDIRTPMNGIIGMTEIAQNSLDDREKVADCLGKMKRASHTLLALINDVLDMSRIESGRIEIQDNRINLKQIIDVIEEQIGLQAERKGIKFEVVKKAPYDEFYIGDDLRLNQILNNLLSNALKFVPLDGTGVIRLEIEPYMLEGDKQWFYFKVVDNGCGIAPENQERIFKPFEQETGNTVHKYGGTGLGLSIVKNFVEMMGGRITINSELGKGSTFIALIPLGITAQDRRSESDKDADKNFDFAGKNILLVEDNELNQEVALAILSVTEANIEVAGDGEEAVEKFKASTPNYYDLILMDVQMPIMDGHEATRTIRALSREDSKKVPILAMSANAFAEDVQKSLESGMDGHISKPVNVSELLDAMNKLI